MNYQNKTIVITGAAKGIGAACAKVFLEAGANVGLLDIDVISSTDNERSMSVEASRGRAKGEGVETVKEEDADSMLDSSTTKETMGRVVFRERIRLDF